MPNSNIPISGPWTSRRIRDFLDSARIPIRLAANTPSGFPVVLSLWFIRADDDLLAAIHQDSRIAHRLEADPRCAFEIAPNEPPYCGVRGQAIASLEREGAGALLETLLLRYLETTESQLGRFLLGRAHEEYLVRLRPVRLSSWDYRKRMADSLRTRTPTPRD